jgi:hypothetical protein
MGKIGWLRMMEHLIWSTVWRKIKFNGQWNAGLNRPDTHRLVFESIQAHIEFDHRQARQ